MAKKQNKKLKSKPKKSKFFLYFVLFCLLLIAAGVLTLYAGYKFYTKDLPDLTVITGYKPILVTEVYSSDGTLIGEFAQIANLMIGFIKMIETVKGWNGYWADNHSEMTALQSRSDKEYARVVEAYRNRKIQIEEKEKANGSTK